MTSFRAGFSEPAMVTTGVADSVKYRSSCDQCQNTKVRCSQDKPTCRRCAQRGVTCVYSQLRRIGRPRKAAGDDAVPNEQSSESRISATASPGGSSRVGYTTSATNLGDSCRQSDFAMADVQMMNTQMTGSSQHPVLQPNGNEEPLRSAVHSWISNPSMLAQSHAPEPHPEANCYMAILMQTTKLVEILGQTALPLGVDLVFEAERDFNALRYRLFTCTGHGLPPPQQQGNDDRNLISPESTNSRGWPCLASDRPVLLSLALLAEHVVGMLEDMFHLAAQAAHTLDKTNLELSLLGSEGENGVPFGPSARRLQRSCRSLWVNPCVPPLVEASRDLRLEDFLVENPAKSKAMRRLLALRAGRMLQALQGMRGGRWRGERDGRHALDAPLDWGGSSSLMSDIADTLVDDLIRRVESLQGAMALIRNDSMI